MNAILSRLQRNHEILTCRDVYKAIFQCVNGPGHLVETEESAGRMLLDEIADLNREEIQGEKMIEFLCDDYTMCRVNLRPYLAHGGDPDKLARAFFLSARECKQDPVRFKSLWKAFVAMVDEGLAPFERGEAQSIDKEAMKDNYEKNSGHSEVYRKTYRPAYRVILTKYLETLW